jgi:hypothetical protein
VPPERLAVQFQFSCCIVYNNATVHMSKHFPATLFTVK